PVGGQSGIIKLKWGSSPDSMKIKDTPGFIKFALGENVKRAGWGSGYGNRFPQTRMGVEQVYYDAFIRAKEYEIKWAAYAKVPEKLRTTIPAPRIDLELETLNEIINSERFISCHSYQQGEINMLMHVADSMGFVVNTFTHILEGYKVADKMKKHGAGGSTFSDWWAYKFEVNDAIPHNGAIMHKQGIVTAFNSDDAEMGRRLNQEAAKAVKYGGLSEEEAWKFVTLNPAKLLHLDDKMGSIKIGKDADVVLWSDNPLSIYAKVEKTIIEGAVYFDIEKDVENQEANKKEKARIIEKMITAKKGGAKTQEPNSKKPKLYHCDTVGE
ncbi:MAG: amidohydrolase family protein, partial [Vicingaceae bacterium]